jgi:hypothetical protein
LKKKKKKKKKLILYLNNFNYKLIIFQKKKKKIEYEKNRDWNNFVNDCGKETFISNGVKAKNFFIKYYE